MTLVQNNITETFRSAMRQFAGTVCLVTSTDQEGRWAGIAATSIVSVSMDPPSLLVCIHSESSLIKAIDHQGGFCVNMLASDSHSHCGPFSDPTRKDMRFKQGVWDSRGELPYLTDAQVAIFCDVAQKVSHGTHTIFVGNVRDTVTHETERNPLIYFNREFATCNARIY